MNNVLAGPEFHNEESKTEFKSIKDKPGIHIYNPEGIQKFNDVFMEATFRKDMKTVSFEYWWSARMDMPLLELLTEQLRPGCLNYTLDDYDLRRYVIPETNYQFEPGKPHALQFHLGMEKGYPLYSDKEGCSARSRVISCHRASFNVPAIHGIHDDISFPSCFSEFQRSILTSTLESGTTVRHLGNRNFCSAVYEWWWSKTMDFPLFEVTSEQYREKMLQYYIDDYNTKSKGVGNRDFYYVIGEETRTRFYYDVKDRYLVLEKVKSEENEESEEPTVPLEPTESAQPTESPGPTEPTGHTEPAGSAEPTPAETTKLAEDGDPAPVQYRLTPVYQPGVGFPEKLKNAFVIRINGRYSLFELLDRFSDASPYDRFYIKGDLDIKVIRIPYEDPLPVPLSLPLTSAGILKGDRYEIKGKNPRNAQHFRLIFGDQSLEIPLGPDLEEFALEITGEEDGHCTAKLNDVELPGVISKGPFLTDRMVLEGDVDFNWVIITKPGGPEAAIEESQGDEPKKEEAKEKATENAKEKKESVKE
ncbi:hypothetical protein MRX96_011547 [Rhipicephalus microplus]